MAKSIMIQGTASNVGKSLFVGGLCRIFNQDGYRVAPFKSQNMALNSFITKDGKEMGRAQVMQAECAGIEPNVKMNPILLKPTGDSSSQVIVNGHVLNTMSASEYYKMKDSLRQNIMEAYNGLAGENEIIVIEGAGSPAEINLNTNDIVNMGMAKMANAPVILVGDIDRGGVFASLYGTIMLLSEEERQMVKGVVINKFRGDIEIFRPGIKMLEELLHIPVLGVIPYMDVDIDDEDSLAERLDKKNKNSLIDIVVIRFPRISNFTDFNAFELFDSVSLRYVSSVSELKNPDLIILPGTKNTIKDLLWLRKNGLEAEILKHACQNKPIIGICGGYQMLGNVIKDEMNLEGGGEVAGLKLLDAETFFEAEKVQTRVKGNFNPIIGFFEPLSKLSFEGYEIHMGITKTAGKNMLSKIRAFDNVEKNDGLFGNNVFGSYVHGIFDHIEVAQTIVNLLLKRKGSNIVESDHFDMKEYKDKQYDIVAAGIRNALDMESIYTILND